MTRQPWDHRVAIRVTKDAERRIRAGHPWVFDGSIRSVKPGEPGDLAVIFDHERRFLAIGLYDPDSPIPVRVLAAGKPTTIDETWLRSSIAGCLDRRRSLVESTETTAYRVIHGENDGFGGLVVDRYIGRDGEDVLVVKLYTAAWVPWLDHLVQALLDVVGGTQVVLRLARRVATEVEGESTVGGSSLGDGSVIHGPERVTPVVFREHGLWFSADPARGHKTGHFLDQRDNRKLVGSMSDGAKVLDVFACTGGFSVHAAAGGAVSVTSVDVSAPALELARANMALNRDRIGTVDHRVVVGDAFEVMEEMIDRQESFDVVVVDPPAFAQRRSQVPRALEAYERLAGLAARLTAPGGLLLQASCSARISEDDLVRVVGSGVNRSGRRFVERRRLGQPLDHPIGFPEGAYLNAVLLELD